MIHHLLLYNKDNLETVTLFDDKKVQVNSILLVRLIQAMTLLSQNLGETKGGLTEVELGKYQIGIVNRDELVYVILQDMHDNEPFTRRILDLIIDKLHSKFHEMNFKDKIPQDINEHIIQVLNTMKFPMDLIGITGELVDQFQMETRHICDTVAICDLDDGIVKTFVDPRNDGIIRLLLEILSELPFEKSWFGEMVTHDGEEELWFLQKIGLTDFTVIGRAVYNNPNEERDLVSKSVEVLTNQIHQLLLSSPLNFN